jgi:hypothetical protein
MMNIADVLTFGGNNSAAVAYANKLQVHSRGDNIADIIEKYRPNEPEFIRNYRRENVRKVTKAYWRKAVAIIKKAQRSTGIITKYPDGSNLTQDWVEENKIKDKIFGEYLELILEDPRAVFVVIDSQWFEDLTCSGKNAETKVFTFISQDVKYHDNTNLVVSIGDAAVWFDYEEQLIKAYKSVNGRYEPAGVWEGLDGMYFFGGGSSDALSFFDGAIDFWMEALVQYSDLQGCIKSHAYPIPVVMQIQECKTCKGIGKIKKDSGFVNCHDCNGNGVVGASPYSEIHVSADEYKKNPQLPWPPVYYPQKDLEPIKLLREEYEANILRGLSALNMEFIGLIGANQSGIAKAMDRDELNGTIHSWVDHLFNYLFYNIVKNAGIYVQRTEVITYTIVPETFDVYGIMSSEESIAKAKEAGMSRNIIRGIEKDYVINRYDGMPIDTAFNLDLITFDSTYGLNANEVETMLMNNGISKSDYAMSINLYYLLSKAYTTIPDFFTWDFSKKYDWLIAEADKLNRSANGLG